MLTDPQLFQVSKAFEALRLLDREIPGQLVSAFLYIASHNPCEKQELEKALQLTGSSGSRLVAWLSDYHRLGKPGLDLIKKTSSPDDQRRLVVSLTPKGQQLAQQIRETIYG